MEMALDGSEARGREPDGRGGASAAGARGEESLMGLYLRLTKPAHGLIVQGMVLSALSVAFGFVPYLIAIVIAQEALAGSMFDAQALALMVLASVVCAIASRLLFGIGTAVCHRADADFRVNARHILLGHFSRLPLGWFSDRTSSEAKQAVSDDVLGMHQSVGHAPIDLVNAVLTPLVPLAYLFTVDWRLSLLMVGYLVVVAGVSTPFMMRDYSSLSKRYNAANVELSASVVEMVEGIEVVKAFGSSKRAGGRFRAAAQNLADVTYAWTKLSAGPFSLLAASISPGMMLALIGLAGCLFVMNGWCDFATCVPFLVLGANIPSGLMAVSSSMGFLRLAKQNLEHIAEVLAVDPLPEKDGAEDLPSGDLDVVFDRVSFVYSFDSSPALCDIDVRLAPGTVTALVGGSGSGKTTFARLIPRFWDPVSGAVRIGGKDLREASSESVLSKAAVVFQESMMLGVSIRDNIKLARPAASDDEMMEAAKASQIHERIMELPLGYDTVIGSSDGSLSGGEAQRVAIARALIQDAPILVLDEATAHADPENETAIQEALGNLVRGRTTVVIAHRLNTVIHADRILVMESGRIVEEGTHEQLLEARGRYAGLWEAQQAGACFAGHDGKDLV